ncbi:hypothetical protein BH20ACI4_BH20ACI4_24770 [soil metagenome]
MKQKDFQKRDQIIFGKEIDWKNRGLPPGVCERFDGLYAEGTRKLLALGFMELSQTMNGTPTIESFLEFASGMKQFDFKFEGFAFDPNFEKDRSVCLEGIYLREDYPPEIGLAFAKFVSGYQPDELSIEESFLRAWWD